MDDIHAMIFEDALHTAIKTEKNLLICKSFLFVTFVVALVQTIRRRC